MDRALLLKNAAKRLIDEAFSQAALRVAELKSEAASAGRSGGRLTNLAIEAVYVDRYRDGCIAVMDKIQLEDREGALETAQTLRIAVLDPAANRFANCSLEASLGKRPDPLKTFTLGTTASAWYKQQTDLLKKLKDVQENVVEEFQLAVTRHSPRAQIKVHIGAFVDPARIESLRAKTSVAWDFSRLVALCEEINTCWQYGAHHAVAMLTRAIMDHVPPVLGQKTFSAVAASYGGSKSFKESMAGLEHLSRKISDSHLHTPIRDREVLPNANQVDFKAGLDVLLGEIIRITP